MKKRIGKKLKALVIAPQPFFSPRGTPFSVYYRTMVMASKGIEMDLLTYGEGQDVDIPGVHIIRIPRIKSLGDIKIGPSFPKLVLDFILCLWTIKLMILGRYDFVHAHEEAVFFCSLLKPIFRFKLIYDMHSSLPQQLSNFSFTKSKLLINTFRILEDASLRAADAVITICPDLAEYVRGRISDLEKHFLIENSIFDPVKVVAGCSADRSCSENAISQVPLTQFPPDRRIVLYAGTLEPYQGIEILVHAIKLVVQKIPEALLVVVGGSPSQIVTYRSLAETLGIERDVIFTGQLPQAEAQRYSQLAEVLVSPRVKGTNTPLKIYQQLASGKPLVATRIYSHTQVLSDEVAFLVDATAEGLANGIEEALRDEAQGTLRANRAVSLYQSQYARSIYESKIDQVLSRVT